MFHVQGDITWRSNSASNLTFVVDTHNTGPILSFIEKAGSAELKIHSSTETSKGFPTNEWSTGLTLGLALLAVFVTRFSSPMFCLLLLSVLMVVSLHYATADDNSVERADVTILVPRSVIIK